ncbi:hypothetical protein [Polynucleobacter sp.]|uniref:hypothetical protein n=1 Tax=Polynucleobacter sp. TaxID=2029855 RepID=UPI003F6A0EB3
MLKVKDERFSIQGTGQVFSFKKGDIVAYEIFDKEFPANGSGQVILKGLLSEGILEEIPENRKTETAPKAASKKEDKNEK